MIRSEYNEWYLLHEKEVRRKAAAQDHRSGQKLTAEVVRYSHLKNYILSGAQMPDIIIACNDEGELTDYAEQMIRDFFADHPRINLVYGDEDRVGEDGKFLDPWLKPDWSPDTFLSTFYFGNIFAVRARALALINPGDRSARDIEPRSSLRADSIEEEKARNNVNEDPLREWIYGTLCLKLAQADGGFTRRRDDRFPIGHIDEILFHSAVKQSPWDSNLIRGSLTGRYSRESAVTRLISIIVPSKDSPDMLERCLTSIEKHARVPHEIIVVDNGSSLANKVKVELLVEQINNEGGSARLIYEEFPFNMSRFYNIGAQHANGEMLLFVHDDIVVQKLGWLSHLSEKAKLPYVGAVGMKLLYPSSNIIQHAGIFSTTNGPVYKLQYCSNAETYYFGFNKGVRNVLALSSACIMVRRDIYDLVGGFDEENFPDCYSDIDFCFRIYEQGYYNVVRNNMYLFYNDAVSPENEKTRVERDRNRQKELAKLASMHPGLTARDPFYNRYLSRDPQERNFVIDFGAPDTDV